MFGCVSFLGVVATTPIVALASAETKTELCSPSGPSGPRTRVFEPLSGHRLTVSCVLGPSGNTAAGACQRPDRYHRSPAGGILYCMRARVQYIISP